MSKIKDISKLLVRDLFSYDVLDCTLKIVTTTMICIIWIHKYVLYDVDFPESNLIIMTIIPIIPLVLMILLIRARVSDINDF